MAYTPNPDPSTATNQLAQINGDQNALDVLNDINVSVTNLTAARGIAADLRATILSGTVTTVSTVTNQSLMGGFYANNQIPAVQNTAAQANINNVIIT